MKADLHKAAEAKDEDLEKNVGTAMTSDSEPRKDLGVTVPELVAGLKGFSKPSITPRGLLGSDGPFNSLLMMGTTPQGRVEFLELSWVFESHTGESSEQIAGGMNAFGWTVAEMEHITARVLPSRCNSLMPQWVAEALNDQSAKTGVRPRLARCGGFWLGLHIYNLDLGRLGQGQRFAEVIGVDKQRVAAQ